MFETTRVSFVWRNVYFNAFSSKFVFKYEMSFQSIPATPYITFRFRAKASKLLVFTTVRACAVFPFILPAISTRRNVLYTHTAHALRTFPITIDFPLAFYYGTFIGIINGFFSPDPRKIVGRRPVKRRKHLRSIQFEQYQFSFFRWFFQSYR